MKVTLIYLPVELLVSGEEGLTVQVLHMPLALRVLWDDGEVQGRSVWKLVPIMSVDHDVVFRETQSLHSAGQSGAVVVEVLHLDGYGPRGSFPRHVCERKNKGITMLSDFLSEQSVKYHDVLVLYLQKHTAPLRSRCH